VSLFRPLKVSRHSRRARTPMYSPTCTVVVMRDLHTRTEVHQKTEAVVGKRAAGGSDPRGWYRRVELWRSASLGWPQRQLERNRERRHEDKKYSGKPQRCAGLPRLEGPSLGRGPRSPHLGPLPTCATMPTAGSPAVLVLLANPTDEQGEKSEAKEGCRASAAVDLW
jgi:hypothetical protein